MAQPLVLGFLSYALLLRKLWFQRFNSTGGPPPATVDASVNEASETAIVYVDVSLAATAIRRAEFSFKNHQ